MTDTEASALEGSVFLPVSKRTRHTALCGATWGSANAGQGARGAFTVAFAGRGGGGRAGRPSRSRTGQCGDSQPALGYSGGLRPWGDSGQGKIYPVCEGWAEEVWGLRV